MQACKFVPGSEIIAAEPSEAVDKLRLTLRVMGAFKNYYFEYRSERAEEFGLGTHTLIGQAGSVMLSPP